LPICFNYQEAMRRSKKLIQSAMRDEMAKHASGEFTAMGMGARMLRHETARLLAWAETDAGGFDVLRLGVAHSLEQGEELPPEALQWLVRYLHGDLTRPKARAGRKDEYWLHQVIWMAVTIRVDEGMTATRNDESRSPSACDAVADALKELGLEPTTFHSVKRIWLRFERNKGTALDAT
jgi:enoyl-CoA hydratase/carnithine racemase